LEHWHWNHEHRAISVAEQSYLSDKHKRDLFSVVSKDKTPLRSLLERSHRFRIHSFWKDNKAPPLPTYEQDTIAYISDKRIDKFVTVVIVGVGLGMLIAPMWYVLQRIPFVICSSLKPCHSVLIFQSPAPLITYFSGI
jgi:hypothetical protein